MMFGNEKWMDCNFQDFQSYQVPPVEDSMEQYNDPYRYVFVICFLMASGII